MTRYAQTEKERDRIIKEFNVKNLSRPALQGPRRDERRPALGDDDEPGDADPAAGRHRGRRGRPTRSSRCSWARRSRRARTSSRPRRARSRTLTSEVAGGASRRAGRRRASSSRRTTASPAGRSTRTAWASTHPRRARPVLDRRSTLDRRFEGWEGIAHGGIVSHDPRRGHGLVPGRPATTGASPRGWRSTSAGRSRSDGRSAPRAGSPALAPARRRHRRRASSTRRPATDAGDGDGRLRRGRARRASANSRERYGFRLVSGPDDRYARHVVAGPRAHASEANGRPASAVDRSAPSRSSRLTSRGRGARPGARRALATTRRRSRRPCVAASPRLADPEYLRRPAARRARDRAGHRRPLAAAGRRARAASARRRSGDRPTPLLFLADRLFREPRARAPLVRVRPPRADAGRRARADLAAPPPGGPRGGRLDHGRHARPSVRQGHPRRALPLGRARAARLLALALGAPARRLDDRHDAPRRPSARPRSRGRGRAPCRSSAS